MRIAALTGSIGMGKTTTAAMFGDLGVPIWDADGAVHRLYARGGAGVTPVSELFPKALTAEGSISRDILAAHVLTNPDQLKQLERIVHPLVGQDRASFLADAAGQGAALVLVDVPLLFETGGDAYVDRIIVVTCDAALQKARVLLRPGMTLAKFEAILARQMPDADKRARAHYIITTDTSPDDTRQQVGNVYRQLLAEPSDTP